MFRARTAHRTILWVALATLSACASLSPAPDLYHEANEKTEAAHYYLSRQQYDQAGIVAEQALADWRRLQSEGSRSIQPWLLEEKIRECREMVSVCRRPAPRRIRREMSRAWDDHYLNGEYRKARAVYEHYLRVIEEQLGPDHPMLAECAGSLGNVYNAVGAYDRAEALYRRALAIRERSEEERKGGGLASSLHDLAWLYECRGEYEKALPLYLRARSLPGYWHPLLLENSLASCYLGLGRIEEACEIFKRTGLALGQGFCHYHRGEYEEAVHDLERSLEKVDPRIRGSREAAHISLGRCYEARQDPERAEAEYRAAIERVEAVWRNLDYVERRNFLGANIGGGIRRLDAYEGLVRVLMQQGQEGFEREALRTAEMVKARTFLEMLAAKRVRGAAGPDRKVLELDRRFQKEIAAARERLAALRGEERGGEPGERVVRAGRELEEILRAYERFINEVKIQDAELASLIVAEPAPLERIQSLLPPDLTVLEYFTARDRSYAWVIDRENVRVHELGAGRDRLAELVNRLRLDVRAKRGSRTKPLLVVVAAPEPPPEPRERGEAFLDTCRELHRLLIGPLEEEIRTERLLIVPHGVLHKVPFGALHDGRGFLAARFSHSVVPSLTAVEYVVKKRTPQGGSLLALADPDTDQPALAFAEKEVRSISDLFSAQEVYVHEEATETRAKGRCGSRDVLHIASHGEFNEHQPMQSGLLLAGDERNDGFLQVHEIFDLDLSGVDLVTLSACDTALSRIYNGDDLVGLSRAFIYAGTPCLLATLWPVEDRSTYLLMESFYRSWITEGVTPPEALRRAQARLRSTPGYEHPFHWAPFVVIGDWR